MASFRYQARNRQGESFTGTVDAATIAEAARIVRGRGLWVTQVEVPEVRRQTGWRQILERPRKDEGILLLSQLSALMEAGLPLHEALRTLADDGGGSTGRPVKSTDVTSEARLSDDDLFIRAFSARRRLTPDSRRKRKNKLADGLYREVARGVPFSAALSRDPQLFPPVMTAMAAAGEESGRLTEILADLAKSARQSAQEREKTKSLLLYPVILLVTVLAVTTFMSLFVLPVFASILAESGMALPLPTRILLAFAGVLGGSGGLILPIGVLVLTLTFAALYRRSESVRFAVGRLTLTLPLFGKVLLYRDWSNVLRTLGRLLASGIPLQRALDLAAGTAANCVIRQDIRRARESVQSGRTLTSALAASTFLPPIVRRLIFAGEQAGDLETMLSQASAYCSRLALTRTERLQTLIEPAMVFFIGGLVFFFVLALILPLLTLMDSVT